MAFSEKLWYLIGSGLLALTACGSKATQATPETTMQKPVMEPNKSSRKAAVSLPVQIEPPESIAPGSCRLVGKILSVLPDLEPAKNTPCGQVPCRAMVKVQRILGYGSAFGKPLAKDQEIKVYFVFTLSPTQRYFPELTTPLPGLQAGDIFQADVTRARDGAEEKEAAFQVYCYTLKNKF